MIRFLLSSLRVRLMVLVLFAIVPALLLTLYTAQERRRMAALVSQENALRVARLASAGQQRLTEGTSQLLLLLTKLPQLRESNPAAVNALLAILVEQYPAYVDFGVVTPDGDIVNSARPRPDGVNVARERWFKKAVERRDFSEGDYEFDPLKETPTVYFGYPFIGRGGEFAGVVYAALDLTWFNQLAAEADLPTGSALTVIDQKGRIFARYPEPGKWVGKFMAEWPILMEFLKQRGEGTTQAEGVDGVMRLYAFTSLGSETVPASAYVCVGIPVEIAYAEANRVLMRDLTWLALVAFLTLLAAWIVADAFVVRHVNALGDAAKQMMEGDLTARTGFTSGPAELRQVAQTFDEMAMSLEQRQAERDMFLEQIKHENKRITELQERLQLHFERMPIGCVTWDTEFRVQTWNPAAERIFGFTADEMFGKHPYGFIVPKEVQPQVDAVWQRLIRGDTTAHSTNENVTKDGRTVVCEWSNTPLKNPDGEVIGVLSMVQDITERKRAEEALREARDQLELRVRERTAELLRANEALQAEIAERKRAEEALKRSAAELAQSNKELEAFTYSVSHDLRAPLRHIDGFTHLLQNNVGATLDEANLRYLKLISESARDMGKLVDNLLEFTRIGRTELIKTRFPLRPLLDETIRTLEREAGGRTVEWNISPLPEVRGDPGLLRVVLLNLLSNALKYTQSRPKAQIEIGAMDGEPNATTIFVRDNGVGFDMQYAHKLFGVFQRLHRVDEYEGTGVGLAITQRIVHRHGGRIWAESVLGQGATFYFTIPDHT